MYFRHIVLAVSFCIFIQPILISSKKSNTSGRYKLVQNANETLIDDSFEESNPFTFVTLLEIIFSDGSKKMCTGTIIHENVVITAAHCFINGYDTVDVDLTSTFVILGTKRMFESGSEKYVPIEKINIHPKFTHWVADLALVHTFTDMIKDSIGKNIRLPMDLELQDNAAVTMYTWGQTNAYKKPAQDHEHSVSRQTTSKNGDKSCDDSSSDEKPKKYTVALNDDRYNSKELIKDDAINEALKHRVAELRNNKHRQQTTRHHLRAHVYVKNERKTQLNMSTERSSKRKMVRSRGHKKNNHKRRSGSKNSAIPSIERRADLLVWQKKIQVNKLTIQEFSYMDSNRCNNFINKTVRTKKDTANGNFPTCYLSERYDVSEKDAGAAIVRNGKLEAVTVGNAMYKGDHITVGMRVICYCSWIAENVPNGTTLFKYCKDLDCATTTY